MVVGVNLISSFHEQGSDISIRLPDHVIIIKPVSLIYKLC